MIWSVIEARLMFVVLKSELPCHLVMSLVMMTCDMLVAVGCSSVVGLVGCCTCYLVVLLLIGACF